MPALTTPPEIPVTTEFLPLPEPPRSRRFVESELLALPPPTYILDQWLPEKSVGFVAGIPNSGKSLLVLDWCMSIARGYPWLGCETAKQSVVYLTSEGTSAFGARIQAWREEYNAGMADDSFIVDFAGYQLGGEGQQYDQHRQSVRELLVARKAGVLVIDPLVNYMTGDANSAHVAVNFTGWCQQLAAELGLVVIIVHHETKAGSSKGGGYGALRNSGAFAGAADWVYSMEAKFHGGEDEESGLESTTLSAHKIKDGEWPQKMPFVLKQRQVSSAIRRRDGEMGTSVILKFRSVQTLEDQIKDYILANPGCTSGKVKENVSARAEAIVRTLRELEEAGLIENRKVGKADSWHLVFDASVEEL